MYSVQIETSDGTLSVINLGIEYFEKNDISLYRNDTDIPLVLGEDWQWTSDTAITLLKGAEPAGNRIIIIRTTDKDRAFNVYDGNAPFSRETLDENFRQMIYLAQEFTEGSGIAGLYRNLNMHGNRIVELGDPIDATDATNKQYVDTADNAQKERIAALENSVDTTTVSYPWYTIVSSPTDTLTPPLAFTKASVYIDGVCQTPDYSYVVVDNQILLASPVPTGTMVFARLGEDTDSTEGYATTAQLSAVASHLDSTKAASGANTDITSLGGLTTPLSAAQGGTGNTAGRSTSSTKLDVPRGLRTNLASTSAVNFDGTADVSPGVTGVLGTGNGGTGGSTPALARTALGAAGSGVNADINQLNALTGILGVTAGTAPTAGNVGEVLSAVSSSGVSMTSGTATNLVTLSLPAGEWEVSDSMQITNSSNVTTLSFGSSSTTGTLPTNWYERYSITTTIAGGVSIRQGATRRIRTSSATTVYLVGSATFTGTVSALGYIRAQRVR